MLALSCKALPNHPGGDRRGDPFEQSRSLTFQLELAAMPLFHRKSAEKLSEAPADESTHSGIIRRLSSGSRKKSSDGTVGALLSSLQTPYPDGYLQQKHDAAQSSHPTDPLSASITGLSKAVGMTSQVSRIAARALTGCWSRVTDKMARVLLLVPLSLRSSMLRIITKDKHLRLERRSPSQGRGMDHDRANVLNSVLHRIIPPMTAT